MTAIYLMNKPVEERRLTEHMNAFDIPIPDWCPLIEYPES